jgi:hypothetical protein
MTYLAGGRRSNSIMSWSARTRLGVQLPADELGGALFDAAVRSRVGELTQPFR